MTIIVVSLIVGLFAWQGGYWVGRRQRPLDNWDWRWHAVNYCGFVHKLHIERPQEYNEIGQRYDHLYPNGDLQQP